MSDDATHTPAALCWHCDRMLDAATPAGPDPMAPTPDAVSLCLYCGAVAIFTDDLSLRPPTEDELGDLEGNAEFRRTYASFSWGRQYLMIKDSLMRKRDDPDR